LSKFRTLSIVIGVALLSASVALAGKVQTQHDPEADFSGYRTYAWKPAKVSGTQRPPAEVEAYVRRAIDTELSNSGLTAVDGEADLFVTFLVTTQFNSNLGSFGEMDHLSKFGYSATGIWGTDWNDVMVENYSQGTLMIDLIDAGTNHLVWRAYARAAIKSAEKNRQAALKAIRNAFKDYPPRKR
jgi:hypothetical protein